MYGASRVTTGCDASNNQHRFGTNLYPWGRFRVAGGMKRRNGEPLLYAIFCRLFSTGEIYASFELTWATRMARSISAYAAQRQRFPDRYSRISSSDGSGISSSSALTERTNPGVQ